MSNTTVNLGHVPLNRGEYQASPVTKYYKDNLVQYNNNSYIANPSSTYNDGHEGSGASIVYYLTRAPYVSDPTEPNDGWSIFASGTAYLESKLGEIGIYDISANHLDAHDEPTKYADLAAALGTNASNIPLKYRKGGMLIKFSNSTTSQYELYKYLLDYANTTASNNAFKTVSNWDKINNVSVTQNTLTIGGEDKGELAGQLIENPEWIWVVTDSTKKVLFGIHKTDGSPFFGYGCPPQVVEYVTEQLGSFDASDYANIKTFLGELIDGDTLATLLNGKVDKVTGKSLIDAEYASSQSVVENPEFWKILQDNEHKLLSGYRKPDGKFVVPAGIVGVTEEIQILLDDVSSLDERVDDLEEEVSPVVTHTIYVSRDGTSKSGKTINFSGLTAIADAINSITDASKNNRYIIHVEGFFHFTDPLTLTMQNILGQSNEYSAIDMRPYIDIEGEGPDNSVVFVDFPANATFHSGKAFDDYQPVFFCGTGGTIRNMKIIGKNCRYAFHIEVSGNPVVGGNELNIENCEVVSLGAPDYRQDGHMACFGTGMIPSTIWNIKNCRIYNTNPADSAFGVHTPLNLYDSIGVVNFLGCYFRGKLNFSNYQVENNTMVNMIDCTFDKGLTPQINYEYYNNRTFAKRGDYTTQLFSGNSQKALYYFGPWGTAVRGAVLRVVSLSTGVSSVVRFDKTSSAFNVIVGDSNIDITDKTIYGWDTQYGMVYRDGGVGLSGQAFGILDIDEGSSTPTSSLGAKLGDCSTTNKVLVISIDGTDYTITFNENFTEKDNAYVIGKINDVIGSVATADVFCSGKLYYPSINGLSNVESDDDGAILKGMGVAFNADGKMVKAKNTDGYIDGICIDDTSKGQTGRVIVKGYLPYHGSNQWFRLNDNVASGLVVGVTLGINPDLDGQFMLNATPALLRCRGNNVLETI